MPHGRWNGSASLVIKQREKVVCCQLMAFRVVDEVRSPPARFSCSTIPVESRTPPGKVRKSLGEEPLNPHLDYIVTVYWLVVAY